MSQKLTGPDAKTWCLSNLKLANYPRVFSHKLEAHMRCFRCAVNSEFGQPSNQFDNSPLTPSHRLSEGSWQKKSKRSVFVETSNATQFIFYLTCTFSFLLKLHRKPAFRLTFLIPNRQSPLKLHRPPIWVWVKLHKSCRPLCRFYQVDCRNYLRNLFWTVCLSEQQRMLSTRWLRQWVKCDSCSAIEISTWTTL